MFSSEPKGELVQGWGGPRRVGGPRHNRHLTCEGGHRSAVLAKGENLSWLLFGCELIPIVEETEFCPVSVLSRTRRPARQRIVPPVERSIRRLAAHRSRRAGAPSGRPT